MLKKLTDALFNVFYYKVALMVLLIPTLLVYCVSYDYKLLSVMMYWGALVCGYDLLVRRRFVRARGMVWLLGFLAVFFLTVFLNYSRGFALNFTSWAYAAIALFLLYPDGADKDRATVLKELSVINNVFIGMTTVLSTVSLGMFVCLYSERVAFGDQLYSVGWVQNRLFGVYSNTGYMITAIGLALIVLQVAVVKAKNGKLKKPYIAFLAYTAVVDFFSMCMENAKGAFISVAAFAAVAVFFAALRWMRGKGKRAVLSVAASLVAAVLVAGGLVGVIYATRPALAYVPVLYRELGGTLYTEQAAPPAEDTENSKAETPDAEKPQDQTVSESEKPTVSPDKEAQSSESISGIAIDREIDESYDFFTGRTVIWKFGLEEFLKKPIFGHGPQSHRDVFIVDNYLRHFHNLIIQTLVSVGTVGSVCIFAFFVTVLAFLLKKLFVRLRQGDDGYTVAVLLAAFLGMLIVNSMAEVTILFITRFAMFLFWIYLGYALALLTDGEQTRGVRFLQNVSDKADDLLKKKERYEK